MQILFEMKVDINVWDRYYNKILQTTLYKDYNQVIQMLFKKKVDINI